MFPFASVTSTKQFIWCGNTRCEVREANSNLSNQYFTYGQVNFSNNGTTATNYYYTRDSLGSIREVTDANGNIISQYNYTVFGQAIVTNGINGQAPTVTSDFGYAGYYFHQPSGLNLTVTRAYSPSIGRWLTRDPIGEHGGVNLYAYVMNDPIDLSDPSGLWQYYAYWGGPNWANNMQYITPTSYINFPYKSGQPGFVPPRDPRDYCYYLHDICLHNAAINNSLGKRFCETNKCNRNLGNCLSANGGSPWEVFFWQHVFFPPVNFSPSNEYYNPGSLPITVTDINSGITQLFNSNFTQY